MQQILEYLKYFCTESKFDQQVLIYCSMASHSANFPPKKQRTEGGVAVLYWCIVACWFRDSRTVELWKLCITYLPIVLCPCVRPGDTFGCPNLAQIWSTPEIYQIECAYLTNRFLWVRCNATLYICISIWLVKPCKMSKN